MLALDFGVINDSDSPSAAGVARTTVVSIPGEGDLPAVPARLLTRLGDGHALVPTRGVLAGVPSVTVAARGLGPYWRFECHLLWIAERSEWIALVEERSLDLDGWLGEGSLSGPYRVDSVLAEKLAESYGPALSGVGTSVAGLSPAELSRRGGYDA